ncbi:MAG: GNAT family N-acetyltransferase [Ruminococcus sp.]|nr:GNAT family N-acetyltransferase [Ruminococcus sp.]
MTITIRKIEPDEKDALNTVVDLHLLTFKGFFLSSMDRGFLYCMYRSMCEFEDSTVLMAFDGDRPIGFIAYVTNISNLYKYMIQRHLLTFGWHSFLAFLRKPSICAKLFRALKMPSTTKRNVRTVKLSSIGVDPEYRKHGVGSKLITEMKNNTDFDIIDYITLETDAVDNDHANAFYKKNEFRFSYQFVTPEGRAMNVYHYRKKT